MGEFSSSSHPIKISGAKSLREQLAQSIADLITTSYHPIPRPLSVTSRPPSNLSPLLPTPPSIISLHSWLATVLVTQVRHGHKLRKSRYPLSPPLSGRRSSRKCPQSPTKPFSVPSPSSPLPSVKSHKPSSSTRLR